MRLTMPWSTTEAHHNGSSGKLDDVRQALGKEVDRLAQVAAQLGHDMGQQAREVGVQAREVGVQAREVGADAGQQAATVAQGASINAGSVARQLIEGAATIGPAIALMGRRRAKEIGQEVQSLGQELRQVRLTTAPRPTGPDMMPGIALLGGFGAGIALMYFLDPSRGKTRRALLRDQFTKWTRIGRETATGRAKDLRNRTVGVVAEAKKAVISIRPEVAELETDTFESNGFGATQTPEAPEQMHEQETPATVH